MFSNKVFTKNRKQKILRGTLQRYVAVKDPARGEFI
jgi:hypothetical protein